MVSTVTDKGRVTVPKAIRDQLGIRPGTKLEFELDSDRAYGPSRVEISGALRALAGNATVQLESRPAIARTIALYEPGPADFADCLLAAKGGQNGCEAVRTFDRKMRALPGVKLL